MPVRYAPPKYADGLNAGAVGTDLTLTSFVRTGAGTPAAPGVRVGADNAGLHNEGSRIEMNWAGTERAYWGATNHNYQSVSVLGTLTPTTLGVCVLSGFRNGERQITANHIATTDDFAITCDPTAGAITVSLPAANAHAGRVYVVAKTVAHANAVTIDPNGADTIDGAATLAVANNTAVMFISDGGTNWILIARE